MEALSHPVAVPQFVLKYNNRDITATVSPYVTSVTYTDKLEGESDEVEIEIEDADGRWRSSWYPEKGAGINLALGFAGETQLPCGDFTLDETNFKGAPDMVVLKGLAAGVTKEIRTTRSVGYDDQTLCDVADKVAQRHGYTVVGDLGGLHFESLHQNGESDLAFLARLARTFGFVFSVRGSQLIFLSRASLDNRPSVLLIPRRLMKEYSLNDKADGVYRACTVSYREPRSGKLMEHTVEAAGIAEGDTLKLAERAESKAHAEAIGLAAIRRSQGRRTEGSIKLEGDRRVVSGNNLELTDMQRLNGVYQITQARHQVTRGGGWDVDAEVSRVPS